jgi:hypothetical protein
MSRPEFRRNEHHAAEPTRPDDGSRDVPDASILESVLRETLAGDAEPLTETTMVDLRRLARRYAGESFALDPHGVELVMTLLRDRMAGHRIGPEALAEVSREVATSLFEVPEIWQRAERLWRNLGETSS